MKARLITLFITLGLFAVTAFAESAGDIRKRMEQRLPQIDALKEQEVIGENNRGLLEERKSGAATAGAVVAAENSDRQTVYTLIAKQTGEGATAESVGKARAQKIAATSKPGVWVQDAAGAWVKRK